MQTPTISQSDYDERKSFLDDLKVLTKDEYGEIYRILKNKQVELSENSNGIFFDMLSLTNETFKDIKVFMELCKSQRKDETARVKEMNDLRVDTKNT
jgi:hypothetical protein